MVLILALTIVLGWAWAALACTTFQLKSQEKVYFGRNYDWHFSNALVVVNQAGVKKPGMPRRGATGKRASWTSIFGSLTFNQYGREFPTGGMNSAGLVLESMALDGTSYPPVDERPYLALAGAWRQYILDNFATVRQALAGMKKVRIHPAKALGTHFLISDAGGDCATVEFLDGKLVVHEGASLPVRALTNNTYAESVRFFNQNTMPIYDQFSSIRRFKTAAALRQGYNSAKNPDPIAFAFNVLKAVANLEHTQWSIVYDQSRRLVYFQTKANPQRRVIDLKRLDFSCKGPVKILDVDAPGGGDITTGLADYTLAANLKLVRGSFGQTSFLKNIPTSTIDDLAAYPDSCKCVAP